MSNDKTLATVKHGGCVQLPTSERARFEAWAEDSYHLQRMGDVYRSVITTDAWRAWQAALSAQPSPAMESMGKRKLHQLQGDGFIVNGVAIFNPETGRRGLVDSFGYVGWVTKPSPGGQDSLTALVAKWRAAAAEHELLSLEADSIGLTVAAMRNDARHQVLEAAADELEAALAARQPVGEPVAYMDLGAGGYMDVGTDLSNEELEALPKGRHMLGIIGTHGADGYKPAQAVDLSPVRALLQRRIEQWRSHLPADPGAPGTREIETKGEHDYNNDVRLYREGIAVMEEVLAKVDSQAVGK